MLCPNRAEINTKMFNSNQPTLKKKSNPKLGKQNQICPHNITILTEMPNILRFLQKYAHPYWMSKHASSRSSSTYTPMRLLCHWKSKFFNFSFPLSRCHVVILFSPARLATKKRFSFFNFYFRFYRFYFVGNNILYIGMYGPKGPCEEVQVKHMGRNIYQVNYFVRERGEYILIIKWGEEHIPGSPYRVEVQWWCVCVHKLTIYFVELYDCGIFFKNQNTFFFFFKKCEMNLYPIIYIRATRKHNTKTV